MLPKECPSGVVLLLVNAMLNGYQVASLLLSKFNNRLQFTTILFCMNLKINVVMY